MAILTATPLVTWSSISEYGPSATSGEISTPLFMGPGCNMSTSFFAALSLASSNPYSLEYSRTLGKSGSAWRSDCMRSIINTSAPRIASSMLVVALHPNFSMPGGSIVGGPATVTSAPIFVKPYMFDLATREWVMSPIIEILMPSIPPSLSLTVSMSSSAWLGCSCAPSPAFTTGHARYLESMAGVPEQECLTTMQSGLMASRFLAVSLSVSPFTTELVETEMFMQSALMRLAVISKEVRVLVEAS